MRLPRGTSVSPNPLDKPTRLSTVSIDFRIGDIRLLDVDGKPIPLEANAARTAIPRPGEAPPPLSCLPASGPPNIHPTRSLANFARTLAVDATPVPGHVDRHVIAMVQLHRDTPASPAPFRSPSRWLPHPNDASRWVHTEKIGPG